jgi:hypothetical protein
MRRSLSPVSEGVCGRSAEGGVGLYSKTMALLSPERSLEETRIGTRPGLWAGNNENKDVPLRLLRLGGGVGWK